MDRLLTDEEMWAVVRGHEEECRKVTAPLIPWEYIPVRAKLIREAQDKKSTQATAREIFKDLESEHHVVEAQICGLHGVIIYKEEMEALKQKYLKD